MFVNRLLYLIAISLFVLTGCPSGDDDDDVTDDDDDSAADDDDTEAQECPETGLPPRLFVDAGEDTALYATAADFTIPTRDGDYNFEGNWNGCDTYLFILHEPEQASGWPEDLWSRDVDDLFDRMPSNTQLFFVVSPNLSTDVEPELSDMEDSVGEVIGDMDEADQLWWQDRVHFVERVPREIEGWLGDVLKDPGWGIGIDASQRIRYIGSYADPTRYNEPYGWFEPNISMVSNEAIYYNFEWQREVDLAAQDATVVPVYVEQVVSGTGYADVELPDAATMATFDTLEFDLYMGCDGEGEYGTCPPWDYDVYFYLCDEEDPESCGTEIGHWITTYHREGRWVHDVSSLLPLLDGGGTRRFAFQSSQTYVLSMDFRLYDQGKESRPQEVTYLYGGGTFNETYNDNYDEVSIEIPADAVKVEIASTISGHGMASPGNCAEFCVTTHHFYVNGTENIRSLDLGDTTYDCMFQAAEGTVPNQYGTWWYGRGGWCPGREVLLETIDVTDQVNLGAQNTFDYEGYYNGNPYTGSGARIGMRSWLVVSR